MNQNENITESIPVGELGIIALESCKELGQKVNDYIVSWRKERDLDQSQSLHFSGYANDTFLLDAKCSRFGTGEAKGTINESVRGKDLFILVDVTNYNM